MITAHIQKEKKASGFLARFLTVFAGAAFFLLLSGTFMQPAFADDGSAQTDVAQQAEDLCKNINTRSQSMTAAKIARNMEYWKQSFDASMKDPPELLRIDVAGKTCLKIKITFFQTIRDLLSGIDTIASMIKSLLNSLLDQVCSYVASAINSALASVCIPLPSLSLSLTLPSISSKTCSGLSLLNVLQAESGGSSSSSSSNYIPVFDTSTLLELPLKRGSSSSSSSGSTE